MTLRALLFDLDGTLLDSLADLADSMNAVLERRGHPRHPDAAYRYFVGDGIANMARRALPEGRRDEESVSSVVADMREEYARRWADKTAPYPGVVELLHELAARGLPQVIFSNKPHEFTCLCVERFLGEFAFRRVQGIEDGVPRKPDPTAPLQMTADLGLQPAEFLYLGDTSTDMKTADAAGMYAVGATWGFRPVAELREAGAQVLVDHPREIIDLLD